MLTRKSCGHINVTHMEQGLFSRMVAAVFHHSFSVYYILLVLVTSFAELLSRSPASSDIISIIVLRASSGSIIHHTCDRHTKPLVRINDNVKALPVAHSVSAAISSGSLSKRRRIYYCLSSALFSPPNLLDLSGVDLVAMVQDWSILFVQKPKPVKKET